MSKKKSTAPFDAAYSSEPSPSADINNDSSEQAPELGAQFEALRDQAAGLSETVRDTAHGIGAVLHEQARLRPYASLGMAAGAGFILGGGISPRLTYALLGMGGRFLAARVLHEVLQPQS